MVTLPNPKPGILSIKPYVGGKARVDGVRAIKLSSNENAWGPSTVAIKAFEAAASELHRYPESHSDLQEAIADAYHIPASELICGAGSDELIGLTVHAFAGTGDEVLYSAHGFLMYKIYALANGATPVTAPEKQLKADVDALLAAVTPRTKILFLANPNNPTGTYVPFSEVQRLRVSLPETVILGLDAAYAEYLDAADYAAGHALVKGTNTIVFHTFSKIYGLPALRLGFAHARSEVIDVLNRVRSPFNVNAPALAAGIEAVKDQAYVADIRTRTARERARLATAIGELGFEVVPSVTNFLLVRFGAKAEAVNAHLKSHGLIVREVSAYGLPEYLRISIGTEAENAQLIAALNEFARANAA
jgi:histidinol-phosphate aminotransferase